VKLALPEGKAMTGTSANKATVGINFVTSEKLNFADTPTWMNLRISESSSRQRAE